MATNHSTQFWASRVLTIVEGASRRSLHNNIRPSECFGELLAYSHVELARKAVVYLAELAVSNNSRKTIEKANRMLEVLQKIEHNEISHQEAESKLTECCGQLRETMMMEKLLQNDQQLRGPRTAPMPPPMAAAPQADTQPSPVAMLSQAGEALKPEPFIIPLNVDGELLAIFREEVGELLAEVETESLRLERKIYEGPPLEDEETRVLCRALHTIKGNAGFIGASAMSQEAHRLEDMVKDRSREWVDPMLEFVENVRGLLIKTA